MGIAVTLLLFLMAFFLLAVGLTAAVSSRMPPWWTTPATRPRLWGAGTALFGLTVLYHAVDASFPFRLGTELFMNDVTPVSTVVSLGMTSLAQRAARRTGPPHPGPDSGG
ncbi:hypothetical protein [Streptomyces cellulosae]|uniref:hypothetical protein n=1 Tax=Streptomyces cellulosae TaxID=1968 RepID=UPI0004C83354|nr:hypothetical protein [Streptomyces cellulosae]